MAKGLTKKQVACLRTLVAAESVEQTQKNRFMYERLVDLGLAFKNMHSKFVKTRGKARNSHDKVIPVVVYAPSPDAFRQLEERDHIHHAA